MLIKTHNTAGGYLLLDHRNTEPPKGLPPLFEADTFTCKHCQRVVIMNPDRKRERYKCRGCDHVLCDNCAAARAAGAACKTFAQVADEMLEQAERKLILP